MPLRPTLSEWQTLGLVGLQRPDQDPRLYEQRGKKKTAVNGIISYDSIYATEYTREEESVLYNECSQALNPHNVPPHQMHQINTKPHAIQVVDGLWMSDLYTATRVDILRELNITHVVSIYDRSPPRYPEGYLSQSGAKLEYHCIKWDWEDRRNELSLIDELYKVRTWVMNCLWEQRYNAKSGIGKVLIHSRTGCQRAPVVALAIIVPSMLPDALWDAAQKLKAVRPGFKPDHKTLSLLSRYLTNLADQMPTKRNDPDRIPLENIFQKIFPAYQQFTSQNDVTTIYRRPESVFEPLNRPPPALAAGLRKDESGLYSAVVVPNEDDDDDDRTTEIAEPADVGNALLSDLSRAETLDVVQGRNGALLRAVCSEGGTPMYFQRTFA